MDCHLIETSVRQTSQYKMCYHTLESQTQDMQRTGQSLVTLPKQLNELNKYYRFPTRLLSTPSRYLGRVSKEEIELMISEIEVTEPDSKTGTLNLLSSQALLAIRYVECSVLPSRGLHSIMMLSLHTICLFLETLLSLPPHH